MLDASGRATVSHERWSRWYDRLATPFERRLVRAGLAKLAAGEGEKILEVGFGTGRALVELGRAVGTTGSVHGVDVSWEMCRMARSRVSRRVVPLCGDARALPFAPGSFDGLFMSFTLELFPEAEIARVLCQSQQALRDGGRACLVSLSGAGEHGLMLRLYRWLQRRFPQYIDCRPIPLGELLKRSGFSILDATRESLYGLPVEIVLAEWRRPFG